MRLRRSVCSSPRPYRPPGAMLRLATCLALALIGTRLLVTLADDRLHMPNGLDLAVLVIAVTASVVVGVRVVLWFGYRPRPKPSVHELPPLTVVIPAFNEGEYVTRSIQSVLRSEYPTNLLSVIVVNDGSTDDTGAFIEATARAHPDRVRVIHLARNRGKRHALHAGFAASQTAFVATLDSDSRLQPSALAHLVAPLVADPQIAGVAGRVAVDNRRRSLISRMLGVCYVLGFDFVRAYQSRLRTVWCCPGALQAYRMSVVRPHLDAWRDQRFLGAACTNGDDHALTNLVLGLGHDTAYQSSAEVLTLVPHRYKALCKMYVRWARSATREGLLALRFAPRRAWNHGGARGVLIFLDAILQPLGLLAKALIPFTLLWLVVSHAALLGPLSLSVLLGTMLYATVYLRSEQSTEVFYGFLYAWFSLVALCWIQPYAIVTVRRNGWLTRGGGQ